MTVVTGYPGYSLVKEVAEVLGAETVEIQEKTFPDGELYVRLCCPEKVVSEDVVVVSTLYPEQEKRLLKTLLIVNAARVAGAKRVVALVPYLAYSRQDKVFLQGEPISAQVIVKTFKATGVDVLVTVDVHSPRVLEYFGEVAVNIVVSDILVEHALKYLENPVIMAPDKGALERAMVAARAHGLEYDYLVKHRDRVTGEVTYTPKELVIRGRDVVLVDDIISTGGTIAEATRVLLKEGARRVLVAVTHGLLVEKALEKMVNAGVGRILLADTLGVKHVHPLVEYVSVTSRIVEELKKVL